MGQIALVKARERGAGDEGEGQGGGVRCFLFFLFKKEITEKKK